MPGAQPLEFFLSDIAGGPHLLRKELLILHSHCKAAPPAFAWDPLFGIWRQWQK